MRPTGLRIPPVPADTNGRQRFNAPPGWPAPEPGWIPPVGWQPEPSWPAAPLGWGFWVDGQGRPVAGPRGRYGSRPSSPGRTVGLLAGVGLLMLLSSCAGLVVGAAGSSEPSPSAEAAVAFADTRATSSATPSTVTTTETATATETVTATVTSTSTTTVTAPAVTHTQAVEVPTYSGEYTPPQVPGGGGGPVSYSSCAEVRTAGAAPLHAGEPGYSRRLDRDGDGIACETQG